MILSEAMAANGVLGPTPAGVRLRLAPAWLRRLWRGPVAAMTTPGTIWLSPEAVIDVEAGQGAALIRHELAHVAQWRRHGWVGFLVRYLGDYLMVRAAGFSHDTAYRAIRLEREAEAEARSAA
jgi:hypothetical protein